MSKDPTPGPWEAGHGTRRVGIQTVGAGPDVEYLALVGKAADAEFIVRACNSHATAIEALSYISDAWQGDWPGTDEEGCAWIAALMSGAAQVALIKLGIPIKGSEDDDG